MYLGSKVNTETCGECNINYSQVRYSKGSWVLADFHCHWKQHLQPTGSATAAPEELQVITHNTLLLWRRYVQKTCIQMYFVTEMLISISFGVTENCLLINVIFQCS